MGNNIKEINIDDGRYPEHLRSIKRPPKKLFCIGNTSLLSMPGIAVVGTRRCTAYGRWASYEIGKTVAECGVTVVSGMAEGIDTRAHLGCLDAGGNTIAVLGTGIDVCYPKSNRDLYGRIARYGLIVSEYAPGDKTGAWAFPERNRIISGLSKSVVVVEGALKSGSMITADLALEQNRDVFAVPGNIDSANSIGVNRLIRDGAVPITSIEEVAEILGIGFSKKFQARIDSCTDEEANVMKIILAFPGIDIEEIAYKTGRETYIVRSLVNALEAKGYLRKEGNDLYIS